MATLQRPESNGSRQEIDKAQWLFGKGNQGDWFARADLKKGLSACTVWQLDLTHRED